MTGDGGGDLIVLWGDGVGGIRREWYRSEELDSIGSTEVRCRTENVTQARELCLDFVFLLRPGQP